MKRMILLSTITITCVMLMLVYYVIQHVLPYSAIRPTRVSYDKVSSYLARKKYSDHDLALISFSFQSFDSLSLSGFYSLHKKPKGTVIVLHGIASCKEAMQHVMKMYFDEGYNVLAYDSRAHGVSGGLNCTLGYYEKLDVTACIDFIESTLKLEEPIVIHGNSMGAAVAMQAMATDKRITLGIIESSFATLRETMYDYMEQFFHVRWKFIAEPVFSRSEQIASFSIDSVAPELSAHSITQPLLLIHGDADEKIDIAYAYRNFAALSSIQKELYIIPNGGHFNLSEVGGSTYQEHILQWLRKVR